ncbi:uncharacterized protein LOC113779951 isoform X2 [Coffea eugenioides]|uniref:uncharacterized protein LOC113779951 isoform X2 n=1 Tax=Coffea eugenioides TaxID=49369 RepID=UPI000F607795|nr:uncharacterized protein LOC113779951 isoform X2 [Coffea eugenioides]
MAVTMSGRTIRPGCFAATGTRSPIVFSKRALKLQHTEINGPRELMFRKGKVQSKPLSQVALATDSADISINTPATSNSIMQFYKSINDKKLKQLEQLLSDDCFFDDYSFPKPFEGKQEVIKFLEQLITSMGQHTEFSVEHICEGDDLTAAVNWHLDWKKKQVPFTRGSSYFGFARDGETKVQAVIESPIKPGGLALGLFKIITSLFDAFPGAAERFLKSPHVIFTLLLKIYNIILQPILNPLIAWYLKLWSFTVGIISITLKILQYIAKSISS